jgi:hypothetical protein
MGPKNSILDVNLTFLLFLGSRKIKLTKNKTYRIMAVNR